MLQKYSKWLPLVLTPVWVVISFFAAQAIVIGIVWLLTFLKLPLASVNKNLLNAVLMAIIYLFTIIFVMVVPWFVRKYRTTLSDIGLDRLPTWTEIFITPAGFVVYLIISSVLIALATNLLPGFNANQAQEVGFSHLSRNYEYVLAFVVLVVIVPVFEEILFRGFLFGKLKKIVPVWIAILITSILFGVLHGAWNVAIDTISLSIVLCLLRQITGSLWPSILLHMTKNAIAYYFLFINVSFLTTLGR